MYPLFLDPVLAHKILIVELCLVERFEIRRELLSHLLGIETLVGMRTLM